ncbi:MAG TPA: YecR family lipoprotein [Steroidobacteraceae bacterium]|nr:YecR family lipoprotein [Steroidobacteraceae bacterium]
MLKTTAAAALLLLFATTGCTTYKLWNVADSDRDTATVALFYEYRKFESPQVDERAGVEMARERCRDWGYPGAQRKSEDRKCVDGEASSCSKWRVVREYRCTGEGR